MLLLLDRGFVSGAFFQAVRARGTHLLGRLAQGIFTQREQVLDDGSYLTTLQPATCSSLPDTFHMRVRKRTSGL